MRAIGQQTGITERHILRIIEDLEAVGYLSRTRYGRRNSYLVHRERLLQDAAIAGLLRALEIDAGAPLAEAQAGDERNTGA
ncbi:MAG: hypothetical protein OHK0022_46590 [Roseiflexaceae bacterium]